MPITSILVHITNDDRAAARLETAVGLALAHEARLVGLYVIPIVELPGYAQAYVGPDIVETRMDYAREQAAKAEADFNQATERAGVAAEWRCHEGDAYDLVTRHARYADLAVVGQTAPDDSGGRIFIELPEQVVLACGRPVIVVPYAGRFATVGEHPLIAWNGSREATRAAHDALPLLARAKQVTVLVIDRENEPGVAGADIAAHLAHHGVRVEAARSASGGLDTGDALLSRASDLGADLIVMGAYGHSRAREWAIGGVTRHLLEHMTVPVLMSH